eukprot:Clim_evm1s130 gene=Clim_evmTU1s130
MPLRTSVSQWSGASSASRSHQKPPQSPDDEQQKICLTTTPWHEGDLLCQICMDHISPAHVEDVLEIVWFCDGTDLDGEHTETEDCSGHVACRDCMVMYCELQIRAHRVPVTCPTSECVGTVKADDLAKLVGPDLFSKYETVLAKKLDPNVADCPKCGTLAYGSDEDPDIECLVCDLQFCFTHGAAHLGKPCKGDKSVNHHTGIRTKLWRMRNSRKCPKCKRSVQRTDGCYHITCVCGHQFCYLCGQEYNGAIGMHVPRMFPTKKERATTCNNPKVWLKRGAVVGLAPIAVAVVLPLSLVAGPIAAASLAMKGNHSEKKGRIATFNQSNTFALTADPDDPDKFSIAEGGD